MKTYLLVITLLANTAVISQTLGKRKINANTTSNASKIMNTTSVDVKMNLKLPFSDVQKEYSVKKTGNFYILNGDIIVGSDIPKTMSYAINGGDYRWPDATLPIVIDPSIYANGLDDEVLKAIKEFNNKTELCLVARTSEKDYIRITNSTTLLGAGSSPVGRQGGEQSLFLASSASAGTAMHELMHAAGFYHEQCREDRDNFISINFDKIKEDAKNNFQKEGGVPIGDYDFCSIMHYSFTAFSVDGSPTISCMADIDKCKECIGQREGFSPQDIASIDMFYSSVSRFPCNTPFPGSVTSTVRFPTVNISESDKAQQSFRHRAEYASKNGFAAGFPNFHEAVQGNNIVGGTILIKHGKIAWQDVPLSWLGNPPLNDFAARMRATQDYAVRNGYIGGFPNYFHADYGTGIVCGTFMLTNASAEWRDVPLNELGSPSLDDIGARMRSANDYAFRNGFLGGFPTFYHANYGKGIVCGIILIKKDAGEWRDVVIASGPR